MATTSAAVPNELIARNARAAMVILYGKDRVIIIEGGHQKQKPVKVRGVQTSPAPAHSGSRPAPRRCLHASSRTEYAGRPEEPFRMRRTPQGLAPRLYPSACHGDRPPLPVPPLPIRLTHGDRQAPPALASSCP